MEGIIIFVFGFFSAIILLVLNDHQEDKRGLKLKEENDKLKSLKGLHIGQVVYAKDKNSLYIGKITKINYRSWGDSTAELNGDETFKLSEIYLTKDEVLKQLAI